MEDRKNKDNKISGRIWEIVEAKIRKVRIAETKERRKKEGDKQEEKERKKENQRKKKKTKESSIVEIKKVAEEWEIWDKEEEVAKSEAKVKKLVPKRFHK